MEMFRGDSLEYHYFESSFGEAVELIDDSKIND